MKKAEKEDYSDFSNVVRQRNILIPEEFPDGSFGETIDEDKLVTSVKSSSWKDGQRRLSAFGITNEELHEDIPRQAPGAHTLDEAPND